MFTNGGKDIVAKYMLGQIPTYASYIAIGCGAKPLNYGESQPDASGYHALQFESFRAKIVSRGYVNTGNTNSLVLTAELPTDQRYEITEIGLFPSQGNDYAGASDSKVLARFIDSENWKKNGSSIIPSILTKLSDQIDSTSGIQNIFFLNSDNGVFDSTSRAQRLERPRFLNQSLVIKSTDTSDYISLTGQSIDFSGNSPQDKIKLAYSVISNTLTQTTFGNTYAINFKFLNDSGAYYSYTHNVSNTALASSRYQVAEFLISDISSNPHSINGVDPILNNITSIQISISKTGSTSETYWFALDGMRLDNISSVTALYDLVAYKAIQNYVTVAGSPVTYYAQSIVKDANTSNFIEFRFSLGVG